MELVTNTGGAIASVYTRSYCVAFILSLSFIVSIVSVYGSHLQNRPGGRGVLSIHGILRVCHLTG